VLHPGCPVAAQIIPEMGAAPESPEGRRSVFRR